MNKQDMIRKVDSLLRHGGKLNKQELNALGIIGTELKTLKQEEKDMKKATKVAKVVTKKAVVRKRIEPTKRGWGGRGESNFDAYGTKIKGDKLVGKLSDGIYMVKGGVTKRMAETNGTGTACVVYRVAANK